MNLQQLKGNIRPLPLFLIVVLLIGGIITVIWLSSAEKLRPEEEVALQFVEAAYVHPDPEKIKPLVSLDHINPSTYRDTYILPGKVKVGYREEQRFQYVIIFIPSDLSDLGNRVELTLENNTIWHVEFEGAPIDDFEEFQTTEFWQRRGHKFEWKDAELH
jgi:hypothetical protein